MASEITFGVALRQFRKRAGIGVFDLAARLGWKGTGPVIELEKDRRVPRISTIDRLGEALKLPYSDIHYLRGLAGYGLYTQLPSKVQILTILDAIANTIADYPFPVYITDFRGTYWLINESETILRGTSYEYLQGLLRQRISVFDVIFDSRLDVRPKLVNAEQVEQEQVFRFKAYNLFRRHEPFYRAYPVHMRSRLLPADYNHFEATWNTVELNLVADKLLYPFGGFQAGQADLQLRIPDGRAMCFHRVEQQILHVNGLFDLIYYRPAGTKSEQEACTAYFTQHRANPRDSIKLWELSDIDELLDDYNQPDGL